MNNRDFVFSVITALVLLAVTVLGQSIGYHSYGFAVLAGGLLLVSCANKFKDRWQQRTVDDASLTVNCASGEK
mgnify:CR=1 FL=1